MINGPQGWAYHSSHNGVSTLSVDSQDHTVDNAAARRVAAAAASLMTRKEEAARAEAGSRRETLAKATLHYETLQKV